MNVVRIEDAVQYFPPKHEAIHGMHLQHKNLGSEAPYWVGCSYLLPDGKAEWDASPLPKVYVVIDGHVTVEVEGDKTTLGPMDSVYLGPNENREVRNETNRVATMLVVMPYPPTEAVSEAK